MAKQASPPKNPKDNLGPRKMPVTQQPCTPGAPCRSQHSRAAPSTTNMGGASSNRLPGGAPSTAQFSQHGAPSSAKLRGPTPQPSRLAPGGAPSSAHSRGGLLAPSSTHRTKSNISYSNASSYNSFQDAEPYVDKQGRPKRFVCCNCGKGRGRCFCSSVDDFSALDVTKSQWWLTQASAMALREKRLADAEKSSMNAIPRNEAEFKKAEQARLAATPSAVSAPVVSMSVPEMPPVHEMPTAQPPPPDDTAQ
ncbi:uncharacterized protein LOC129601162 [Paramacrobiotus metropolitanus]|uniref:uncharacterized protein LOC129601162 n=1 Tax=Paramacrobiotus metropolitanus TaxID=2943436 RepID=UPI0024459CC4|nr:uncharacterized protein LOC129601162 [Paramacrobiotus metropolitanus]